MKKISFLILCLAVCSNTIAHIKKDNVDEKLFYCPQTITCEKKTCTFTSEHSDYFLQFQQPGNVGDNVRIYSFTNARSPLFHSQETGGYCTYKNLADPYELYLNLKPEANLEANYNKNTNWNLLPFTYCYGVNSSACPFKAKEAFVIHSINITGGLKLTINGIDILSSIPAGQYQYLSVTYDSALIGCPNEKECAIDIESSKGAKYGTVTVDMENKLSILKIDNLHPSHVSINKVESFNAIEVSYPSLASKLNN